MQHQLRLKIAVATVVCLTASLTAGAAHAVSVDSDAGIPQAETPSGAPVPEQPPVTELIVKYKPGVPATESPGVATGDSSVEAVDLDPGRKMAAGLRTVEMSEPLDVAGATAVAAELTQDPRVESAEPNLRVFPVRDVGATSATNPNDTQYIANQLWGLNGTYGIDGPDAWAATIGDPSVVVAVLDTGILPHDELPGSSQVPGYDMITSVDGANDGDGRDANPVDSGDWVTQAESDDVGGPYEGCDVTDSSWHGTHVTGTINAASDNGVGVASVAPGVKTQAVRVLGKCEGTFSDVIDAIVWASGGTVPGVPPNANPADVINMSLGGGHPSCLSSVQTAINTAVNNGTTVVVAAGNEDVDASESIPANCNNTVTVGSVTSLGKRSSFSNYGSTVDVAGPGSAIWSTWNTGTEAADVQSYVSMSGTSMATPHVAGLAALMKSAKPSLTPAQVESQLKANVKGFAGGACDVNGAKTCGTGIANADAVTVGLPASSPTPSPSPPAAPITPVVTTPTSVRSLKATYKGANANVKWAAPSSNGGAAISAYRYRISKNNGSSFAAWKSTSSAKVTVVRKKRLKYVIQVVSVNSVGSGPTSVLRLKKR